VAGLKPGEDSACEMLPSSGGAEGYWCAPRLNHSNVAAPCGCQPARRTSGTPAGGSVADSEARRAFSENDGGKAEKGRGKQPGHFCVILFLEGLTAERGRYSMNLRGVATFTSATKRKWFCAL
jgi:hypothetical protein